MYSCRAELDTKIQKLIRAIERGHKERRNVSALEEAIEAKSLLPLMEWLRDHDEKFRSVQELEENINQLEGELQEIDVLEGYLPIARKIEALEKLVAKNKKLEDERNHAGQNSEDESESGWVIENETLSVSGHATVELSGGCDGPKDGFISGSYDGPKDGFISGIYYGPKDGFISGSYDGPKDGFISGSYDGPKDGFISGIYYGPKDGFISGSYEGPKDGFIAGGYDGPKDGFVKVEYEDGIQEHDAHGTR